MLDGMRFHTAVFQDGNNTGIEVPPDIVEALGKGKKPPVKVTLNGYTYRSTIAVVGGAYLIPLAKAHREAAGVAGGQALDIDLELDTEPRTVELPSDLAAALDAEPKTRETFDRLSNSNKGWHVLQVTGAKTDETRQRRIAKQVASLKEGNER